MAKRKRKKKLSRRERKAHPERVPTQPAATEPTASAPEPDAIPVTEHQPEPEAAQTIPVTASFKPTPPPASSGGEPAEFAAVRKDLRKLWLTIAVLILIVAGLAVWNAQTDVVGTLGDAMFSWWQ